MPGPSAASKLLRLRNDRSSRPLTSTAASHVEADRHHQVAEVVAFDRLQQPGTKRRDQPQQQLLALHALNAVLEEVGVEADLQRLALERRRHRLLRIADLRSLGRDRELALRESQPQ